MEGTLQDALKCNPARESYRTTLHYVIQNDGARDLVLPSPPPPLPSRGGQYQAEAIRYNREYTLTWYTDTIPYLPPSPKQTINHCTMPKHSNLLFKKRIMSTFLGLMLYLLAATNSPALENNLSNSTDVPHVPGTPKYIT